MKRFTLSLVLVGFLGASLSASADGMIVVNKGPWKNSPRIHPFAPLEITYHHVTVKIDGQIATTSVDQEFYNPNAQRLEGTYLFPIPKGAQIDKFSMEIGGRQVEAELLAADKARSIYEEIVRQLRDPALLEYAGRDVFKVRVFPIEPNKPKRITLSYSQVLRSEGGLVSYVYPLNTEKFSSKPIKNVSVKVELETERPLKTIYSPSHTVEIKRQGPNRATAAYEAANALPDSDFALYFAPEKDEVGLNLLTSKAPGEDGYFLLLASPGIDIRQKTAAAKDVAFVLDTSGSMMGPKIQQAKKALQFCVESLNENDRFQVMRFSTDVEPLFDNLVEATRGNRDRAEKFVKELTARGGTAIDEALHAALALRPAKEDRPFVVVFLTDGEPTVGVTDEDQIVANVKKNNDGRTRVFCFGLGNDVNTHLLDKIAEETRAANQYVLPEEDIEVKVSAFFSKITEPVLANPTLKFTGGVRAAQTYPAPLPDLFKGEQLIVVGRYSGEGAGAAVIEGTVNGVNKQFSQDVSFSGQSAGAGFLPRLWATRRVGYLLDEIRLHGESAELRDEVTGLARQYGIVTPYTAYLIMEDENRRNVPLAMQSLPQMSTDHAVQTLAAANWGAFKDERGGEKALAGARYGNTLKFANAPAPAAVDSGAEANRALGLSAVVAPAGPSPASDSNVRLAQYTQQTKFVNGRNFFQNGQQWVDAGVQNVSQARRVRIQFSSPDYFALAAREPGALPWLALGQNVQFVLNGTVYDIYQ
ncbi:MAG: VIT domain-containing protein [Verrucomicrobiota bacterium]|jgi:Ca-activated chloride channel family protein